jgi:hypothetical protein
VRSSASVSRSRAMAGSRWASPVTARACAISRWKRGGSRGARAMSRWRRRISRGARPARAGDAVPPGELVGTPRGHAVPQRELVGTSRGAPCPNENSWVRRWARRAPKRTRGYVAGRALPASPLGGLRARHRRSEKLLHGAIALVVVILRSEGPKDLAAAGYPATARSFAAWPLRITA